MKGRMPAKGQMGAVVTLAFAGALILSWLAIGAAPAAASAFNCSDPVACGFGSSLGQPSTAGTLTATTGTWTLPFTEHVWKTAADQTVNFTFIPAGTYTYEFKTGALTTTIVGLSLSQLSTATSPGFDLFNSGLNWGVETTGSTAGGSMFGGITFAFTSSSFVANIAAGDYIAGQTLNFYAQSALPPGTGTLSAQDGGSSGTASSIDPAPEPPSLLLLGLGLPVMGGVVFVRRRSVRFA